MTERVILKAPVENSFPAFSTKEPKIGKKLVRIDEENKRAAEFSKYEREQVTNSDWKKGPGGRVERN